MATKDKTADLGKVTVLAFEKKLVPSDGYFYGTTWDNRKNEDIATPLHLIEKSVRGTISNRLSAEIKNEILNSKIKNPNLQTVDACALSVDQDTLKMQFTLKILSGVDTPSACNNIEFLNSYRKVVATYIEKYGFHELARRYTINLANGRSLWRNRVGADNLEVEIKILNQDKQQSWTFNANQFSTKDFNKNYEELTGLTQAIADTLSGKDSFLLLEINNYAQVGKAQDVYPSEELILDKNNSKDKKSKILYHINGIAGMHSQKLGNALRTIDTWYPENDDINTPIAIEPYGAVTNLGKAFRTPTSKSDFYTLFKIYARGNALETEEQEHYVMAVLVRGGVFGDSKDKD